MPRTSRYGNWGKHIELFDLWEDFNDLPEVRRVFESEFEQLEEGSGAPEGRADFPIFLQTVIRHRMRERFATVAAKWQDYVGIENAQDFREHTVSSFGSIRGIAPVNEDGEYGRMYSAEEEGPSFAVAKHGGTYAVTMELIINDDSDQILNRTPREIGQAFADYFSQVLIAFIETNPTYSVDGRPFFSGARGNEITGADADANETNLMAGLDAMKLQRNVDNIPFAVNPSKVLVRTPSQKGAFDRIVRSQITGVRDAEVAAGQTGLGFGQFFTGNYNPAYNALAPDAIVDEPWFNAPNTWYMLGDAQQRPAFIAAFLRGMRDPFIGLRDPGIRDALGAGTDPYSWWFDSIDYKGRHFFGFAAGEPRAAIRFVPA